MASYYFRHKTLWKFVVESFVRCCQGTEFPEFKIDPNANDTELIAMAGDYLLQNGYVMRKSKYWRKYIKFMMNYILRSFKQILKMEQNSNADRIAMNIFRVQLMIMLFLHYNRNFSGKSQYKYQRYIRKFAKEIRKIHDDLVREDMIEWRKITNKEWCSQLMEMIYCKSTDLGINIVNMQHRIWKIKREDMKCLWYKCDKRAKDLKSGKLRKCKRCGVARYCGKYCQKRHWKHGKHKEICDKLRYFRHRR